MGPKHRGRRIGLALGALAVALAPGFAEAEPAASGPPGEAVELRWSFKRPIAYSHSEVLDIETGDLTVRPRDLIAGDCQLSEEVVAQVLAATPPASARVASYLLLGPTREGSGGVVKLVHGEAGAEAEADRILQRLAVALPRALEEKPELVPPELRNKSPEELSAWAHERATVIKRELTGKVVLQAPISATGRTSGEVGMGEANRLALLFGLPEEPVSVGDHWTLDVDPVSTAGVQVRRNPTAARVSLAALRPTGGGDRLAVIDFCFAEELAAVAPGPPRRSFTTSFAYVGRGEFLVDAGRWARRTEVTLGEYLTVTGLTRSRTASALRPLDPVPERLLRAAPPDAGAVSLFGP